MTYLTEVLADSPVAYWRLQNLTSQVGAWPLTQAGEVLDAPSLLTSDPINGAKEFTSDSLSGLTHADHASLRMSNALTIECWMSAAFVPSEMLCVGKFEHYRLGCDGSGNPRLRADTSTGFYEVSAASPLVVDTPTHLVATFDAGDSILYVNGEEAATGTYSGTLNTTASAFQIGANVGTLNGTFGVVDEVAIYHTVLSPARIEAHYDAGAAAYIPPPTNTVLPVATGTLELTEVLSCTTGTWINDVDTYAYRWQRDPGTGFYSDISGATSSTYVVQADDVHADLICRVTATGEGGSTDAFSNVLTKKSAFMKWNGGRVAVMAYVKLDGELYPPLPE